ncbi:hypothetical protein CFR73_09045 [Novacetimonas maltaceti]|nr:hypothetical protein CFR73_09045 [Novacetimonas maltaceti]
MFGGLPYQSGRLANAPKGGHAHGIVFWMVLGDMPMGLPTEVKFPRFQVCLQCAVNKLNVERA